MTAQAVAALAEGTESLIADVRAAKDRMDRLQRDIDSETVRLLVLYSPVATDLRLLLMKTRIHVQPILH